MLSNIHLPGKTTREKCEAEWKKDYGRDQKTMEDDQKLLTAFVSLKKKI